MDFESAQFYQTFIYIFIFSYFLASALLWVGDWPQGHGTTYVNLNLEFAIYMAAYAVFAYALMSGVFF